jgi:DNA modification methylase
VETDLSLAALVADPLNRRKHNARNLAMVAESLAAVGAARSIVIDEDNVIIAGNGVTAAAASAGISRVRVVEADGDELIAVRRRNLTPEQKRALAMYDNRAAELAEWHVEQLSADRAAGLDLQPWFSAAELAALGTHKRGHVEADEVPPVRATTIVRGDLFELGRHRLLCGDSTVAGDVARVMGEDKADLVFTSPPYGQQRDYGEAIKDWHALMVGVFANLPAHGTTQVLVNLGLIHRDGELRAYWDGWIAWMREHGWRFFGWYVWDQGHGLPGDWNGRLAPSHEFVFHFNKAGVRPAKWIPKQAENIIKRTEGASTMRGADGICRKFSSPEALAQPTKIADSVIRINRVAGGHEIDHPAIFPVEFPRFVLQSWPGDVYEPFCGSGTTLIASEQLDRSCRAIEIEPSYVQITIDRWEAFTGGHAVKL